MAHVRGQSMETDFLKIRKENSALPKMAHARGQSIETDFLKIRKECLAKGILFEDPEFPPQIANLYYHQPPSGVEFEWKRPKELTPSPQFVIDDLRKFDLDPGSYGQQCFISALGILIQYRALFYRAVPADQGFTPSYQYAGVFHFRFWFGGEWVEVLVDDRLPVVNGKLAFVHSQSSDQYWAALLEKAYAKLHGSYESLAYTSGPDVFSELSGGATESILLDPVMPDLAHFLVRNLKLTVITTSVVDRDRAVGNGIVPGTNYGILGVDTVMVGENSELQLVKLKLPPATPPFVGPWASPENIEWKRVSSKDRIRLNVEKEAAREAFWMSLREFEETFTRLELVHLDKETCNTEDKFLRLNARSPQMRSIQGSWRRGSTAGGCRNNIETFHINPQVMLRVDEAGDVVVALLQHNHLEPRVIGFSIYKYDKENQENTLNGAFFKTIKAWDHSTYSNSKQIVKRVYVEHGNYVIVPTTYDVGQEASFTLRAYSEKPICLWRLDNAPKVAKQPIVKTCHSDTLDKSYEDMFLSFADQTKTVNCYELQELLHSCLPNDYMKSSTSLEVCRRAIQAFQHSQVSGGRMSRSQFRDFMCSLKVWAKVFEHYSPTTSGVMKAESLKDALSDVGFDLSSDNFHLLMHRYMRRDGTLRFGDFVASILHLITIFHIANKFSVTTKKGGFTTTEWLQIALRC